MAATVRYGGYKDYPSALHAAYEHFDKESHSYAVAEDFSSVSIAEIESNESLLRFLRDYYLRKHGKGCTEAALFRALADRNRSMIEWLPVPRRVELGERAFRSLPNEEQFSAIAVLQNRSVEDVREQYDQAVSAGTPKMKAFAQVLQAEPIQGIITGVDLETTSGNPERGYIINVGWEQMEMARGASAQIAHSQMAGLPDWYEFTGIPFDNVHHLTWDDLHAVAPFRENKQLQKILLDALKEHPFMAHNAFFEDAWLTLHLDGYAEAKVAGEIKIIDSMTISKALEGNQKSNGGHSLDAWAHRLGVLTDGESEKHLGLDDTDLMLRCAIAEFARNNMLK
ncbi:hypothetical protein [Bifidobacterium sp. UBA744]|uniref:3'-5' exonuclease n=1 Tax=Bifidobacterium sp. UBA744 TaxID=1946112 RepID=UPI0025C5FF36|nr:hypothetical protein [Bifidobacterium sp. UBA744]